MDWCRKRSKNPILWTTQRFSWSSGSPILSSSQSTDSSTQTSSGMMEVSNFRPVR